MEQVNFDIPQARLADFCRRWKIDELSLFGSVLREDFSPSSDVDILVTFANSAQWTMFQVLEAKRELELLLNRSVDLIERPVLEKHRNPWLRHAILTEAKTVYRAA